MSINPAAQISKSPRSADSLTQVLGQSERVKDIVEECADDLSSVNVGLKLELRNGEVSPGVEKAIKKSEAVETKVQDASVVLSSVNSELKEEVRERQLMEAHLLDVTKQGDEARHASLHDPLTGLPNRALFSDRLEHGLAMANRNGLRFSVMFLDLNDFKMINDTHGHDIGDIVLQTIAGRLKETTRDDDTVCRYGGDEFLYLLMGVESEHDITIVAEKIIKAVQVPCDIRVRDIDVSLSVKPSIGISIFPKDGTTADVLLDLADKAMYRAKRSKLGYAFASAD